MKFLRRGPDAQSMVEFPSWMGVQREINAATMAALDSLPESDPWEPARVLPWPLLLSEHKRQVETFGRAVVALAIQSPATSEEWSATLIWLLAKTESPIEWLGILGAAVAIALREHADFIEVDPGRLSIVAEYPTGTQRTTLSSQHKLGKYRADLLVQYDDNHGTRTIVVEFDGHDYHERTKDQAERDRSRDRELQLEGHRVMRFTGRELYRNPFACGDQVAAMMRALWQERV